nr:clp protease proteolytic subunit [Cryptolepis sinensis]
MPIGVPKIPFHIPGDEEPSWVDVYNGLYRRRFLFLGQEVDSEMGNQLVGLMTFLSIEDPTADQYLFINSPGGWVIPGIAVYDTMQSVPPDVHTIGVGLAASMASLILTGGAITKRLAYPHARVMMHQPASSFSESQPAGESVLEAAEMKRIRDAIAMAYVERTGQSLGRVLQDMQRDAFMSATEAKAYGIVDHLISYSE